MITCPSEFCRNTRRGQKELKRQSGKMKKRKMGIQGGGLPLWRILQINSPRCRSTRNGKGVEIGILGKTVTPRANFATRVTYRSKADLYRSQLEGDHSEKT